MLTSYKRLDLEFQPLIGKEGNMPQKDPKRPKPPVLPDEIPLPLPPPPNGDLEEADLPGDSTTDAPPPPPKKDDED